MKKGEASLSKCLNLFHISLYVRAGPVRKPKQGEASRRKEKSSQASISDTDKIFLFSPKKKNVWNISGSLEILILIIHPLG